MNLEPLNVDKDLVQSNLDTVDVSNERQEAFAAIDEAREQQQVAEQEAADAQKLDGTGNELGNALMGGVANIVSDIVTAPERIIDLFNGEAAREGKDYKPEWDDWINPEQYETRTWWGSLLKGTINVAGFMVPIGGKLKALGWLGRGASWGSRIARGAAAGAATDVLMRSTMEDNLSRQIIDHVPEMEVVLGPLATEDTDHPMMRVFKGVVEGMGIGIIFDVVGEGASSALKARKAAKAAGKTEQLALPPGKINVDTPEVKALQRKLDRHSARLEKMKAQPVTPETTVKITELEATIKQLDEEILTSTDPTTGRAEAIRRNNDVRQQTIEKGKDELKSPEFGEHKNKPIAHRHQGTPTSRNAPSKVLKQLDDIDKKQNATNGSTDSMMSVMQAQRSAASAEMSVKEMRNIASGLLSDGRIEAEIARFKGSKTPWRDAFPQAFDRMKRVMDGRNTTDMSSKEFWDQFDKRMVYDNRGIKERFLNEEDLLAADLVIGSLFKQMRDLGIAGRELVGNVDLKDGTGPLKTISDRLVVGLTEVKKSRYLRGLALGELNVSPKEAAERIAAIHGEAKDSVRMMTQMINNDANDNVLKAFIEYFSMGNKVQNWEDMDAFLRAKLRGGEIDGKKIEGATTREMGGVLTHSVLSGPKTPIRALLGTSLATVSRTIAQAVGGVIRLPFTGDISTARASMAEVVAGVQAVPEAFELFRTKLKGYWTGDIATMKSRYSEYTKRDQEWDAVRYWTESRGSDADKAAFAIANTARELNNNSFLTYSTKIMAATDDAFQVIIARQRARSKAIRTALEEQGPGQVKIDETVMRRQEELFYRDLLDEEGNINIESDTYLKSVVEEVTLTTDLSGTSAAFENAFKQNPWIRPWFLFLRTGVNGLALTAKNTPIVNLVLKKQRAILMGSADNLDELARYGITNAAELANEKALMAGRQAIGGAVIFMAGQKFMAGEITGNGPTNRQDRQALRNAGWVPNSIKIGDTWVSYEAFEPFNIILSTVADLGMNQRQMGESWTQNGLMSLVSVLSDTLTSKSYLSGLNDLVDVVVGKNHEKALQMLGNLANNTVPLGSLRNELGKVISPGMREINRNMWDQIRNRNLWAQPLVGEGETGGLPYKYDFLSGEVLRDQEFMTRMWNMFSPVQLNPDYSPGRSLLHQSQYNLNETFMSVDGIDLRGHPEIRSMLQEEMGKENLDEELDRLAARPDVQASLAQMEADAAAGKNLDPNEAYLHNDLIRNLIKRARKRAWARIKNRPDVSAVIAEQREVQRQARISRRNTSSVQQIIQMPK